MTSPLERLTGPGKSLAAEPPDAKEFAGLKRTALDRFKDAANQSNSLAGRFDLAYNAQHALALAALRYHGFRPQVIGTSSFRCCRTRSALVLKYGGFCPSVMTFAIAVNTKAI